MMYQRGYEWHYAVVFLTVVMLVAFVSKPLLSSRPTANTLPAVFGTHHLSACQLMVARSTQSSRVALGMYLSATLALLGIKLVASIAKSRARVGQLDEQVRVLPAGLSKLCTSLGIAPRSIRVIDSPLPLAFTSGIFTPSLTLSHGLIRQLSTRELEAVLLHERHHAQRRHPLFLLLGTLVSNALFFIPVLHDLLDSMRLQFEYSADEAAITQQGKTRYIKRAMLKILQASDTSALTTQALVLGGIGFAQYRLARRIQHLGTPQPPRIHFTLWRVVSSIVCAATLVLFAHSPIAALEPAAPQCSLLSCISACAQETAARADLHFSPALQYTPVTTQSQSL